jgi:colanic acid biosynthesis glycosyl transferase WcaI
LSRTKENGVTIYRIGLPSINRANLVARLLQFVVYQVGATWAGWRQRYDVLLTHTPALEVGLPFLLHAILRKKPAVYSVHDVYPDVGVKLGIFRHKVAIRLVGGLERLCLQHSAKVRILSKSFAPTLQRRGVPESKLGLIYDWVDTRLIKPLPRDNHFAREYNLVDCFVVLYAGNIGFVQGLDSVLQTAQLLRDHSDIRFVFVGDGSARGSLIEKTTKLNLANVRFLPYQPRERMPEVFATADVSLVSLKQGTGFGALPSKIFSILSSGRPVIVSVDPGSDTWNLVECSQAGLCVHPESPIQLMDALLALRADGTLRERMGKMGRDYVEKNHSPEKAAEAFENLLRQAITVAQHQPVTENSNHY